MASLRFKNGVWYVLWREGAKQRALRVGGRTKAERMRVEIEHRLLWGRVTGGGRIIPKRTLFAEYAQNWLSNRMVRPKTLDRDQQVTRTHLLPTLGKLPVSSVGREDVQGLVAHITRQVSPWTARRTLAVLRKMLGDAKRNGYSMENVAADVDAPSLPYVEMRLPTLEQVCALLRAIPTGGSRALVLTLALQGFRWGEATALEWGDFSEDFTKAHVRRALPANTLEVSAPKSASGRRSVELLSPVREALMDLPQRTALVFPGERGGYLNHRWWSKTVWRPTVRALGLRLNVHGLRHFACSLRLAWGEPLPQMAQDMGHSSAAFTVRQYGHILSEGRRLDREDTLRKFWEAYRGVAPVLPRTSTPAQAKGTRA